MRPNRLSALLESKRRTGTAILDLTESNPTRAGLSYPGGAILGALADSRALVYEPQPAGSAEARSTVAGYYRERGQNVAPERILITTSTSESYAYLFKLLADPGDEVLAPRPSYPLFEFLAKLESVRIVQYPLMYHGSWSVDFEALERGITAPDARGGAGEPEQSDWILPEKRRTRAALGPLRAAADPDHLRRSLRGLRLPAGSGARPDAGRHRRGAHVFPERVVEGFRTAADEAGLDRRGRAWSAAEALERLELIADTYLSVATPVQLALPRLLEEGKAVQKQIAQRTCGNLDALRAAIAGDSACQVLDVEGGWYATLRVPRTRSEEEWTLELLEKENVLVQPGFFYDFDSEAYLVLSLLTPPDDLPGGCGAFACGGGLGARLLRGAGLPRATAAFVRGVRGQATVGRKSEAGNEIRKRREVSKPATEFRGCPAGMTRYWIRAVLM